MGGCVAGKTLDSVSSKVKTCGEQCATVDEKWETFKRDFGKVYLDDADEQQRYQIFQKAVKTIDEANNKNFAKNGHRPFGITWQADRTDAERKIQRGYQRNTVATRDVEVLEVENATHPKSIDWTLTEAVTPIKNQGQCGSCWAFSATETIESHFIIAHGQKYGVSLSPQQVTSCTTADYGCGGGEPMDAYDYVMSVPGLTNEWNWPYTQSMVNASATAPCDSAKEAGINGTLESLQGAYAQIKGYKYATKPCNDAGCYHQNLTKLEEAVENGPVSVCVVAQMWSYYTGGVMTAETCGPMGADFVDHCVQLVGFEKRGEVPYWIVRNSWGTEWGEDGNIYLELDMNTCGLADEATIPFIEKGNPEQHRPAMFQQAQGQSRVMV